MGRFLAASFLLAAIVAPTLAASCGGGSLCPQDSPCCSRTWNQNEECTKHTDKSQNMASVEPAHIA